MSHFVFKARKATGEIYSGQNDATDRFELYRIMREHNEELIEYKERMAWHKLDMAGIMDVIFGHVKTIEKINFARNLGSMLAAGLALSRALSVLERQTKNKSFKKIITNLMEEIDKGTTFADALAKHPKIFPPIFIAMVHAGEQSGTLADSLKVVAKQMDSIFSLERRIRGALMYPSVIVTAMIIIAILMFVFVVPTLLKTFQDLKVQLPFATRVILGISTVLRSYGIILFIAVVLLGIGFWAWTRKPFGKKVLHMAYLKIPVIGTLVQEVNAARTSRTLSSLIGSGVDIVESVAITATVVQNVHFKAVLEKAEAAIKKGELMSKIFAQYGKLYPVFFGEMLSVGEETGKTGEMLIGVANYYEEDVEQKTKDMSTIIEPFLILMIGAAVGFFAVSMIQPMYSLVNAI